MSGIAFVGRDYIKNNHGYEYLYVWLPDHPNATKSGHILKHRLVASEMLGRPLLPTEIVHHRNGVTTDNSPDNLAVLSVGEHTKLHKPRKRVAITCCTCGTVVDRKFTDTVRKNPRHFYCSHACRRRTKVTQTCRHCAGLFTISATEARRAKGFCSHRCAMCFHINQRTAAKSLSTT